MYNTTSTFVYFNLLRYCFATVYEIERNKQNTDENIYVFKMKIVFVERCFYCVVDEYCHCAFRTA